MKHPNGQAGPLLGVGVVGPCLDDVWTRAWEGWRWGDQKGRELGRRERVCSSKDPVFMQMLLLT